MNSCQTDKKKKYLEEDIASKIEEYNKLLGKNSKKFRFFLKILWNNLKN